jgi:hypothetical protein
MAPGSGRISQSGRPPQQDIEESLKLKRKLLLSILAVVPAALMPLAATSQVAPASGTGSAERGAPSYKYEVFAGYAYTSLNQVNQSRYGLQGGKLGITRDFGKYFGITATGDYYKYATGTGNPGTPSVISVLAGPEIHSPIYGNTSGFVHALMGGEHTGGESMTPNISFAGGVGGGLEYSLGRHLSLRASGDRIGDSFSLTGNSPALGNSPHLHWNARAVFGVGYRF